MPRITFVPRSERTCLDKMHCVSWVALVSQPLHRPDYEYIAPGSKGRAMKMRTMCVIYPKRELRHENCSRWTRRATCRQFRSLKEVLYGDDGPLHYRRRRSIRLLTSLAGLGTSYPHPHKRREVRPGASRMARRDSGEPGTVCA